MDRTLCAQPPKEIVRRPVGEVREIADEDLIERRLILPGNTHDVTSLVALIVS
jgi:hypothetical protein